MAQLQIDLRLIECLSPRLAVTSSEGIYAGYEFTIQSQQDDFTTEYMMRAARFGLLILQFQITRC
jgi:hypothetical protein